jgi:hypothetical protein
VPISLEQVVIVASTQLLVNATRLFDRWRSGSDASQIFALAFASTDE